MGINFPPSPALGDLWPIPAVPGVPQYKWDGTVWLATVQDPLLYVKRSGDTMTGHLSLLTSPAAANAVRKDYVDAADAASVSAMAANGIQVNGGMEVSQENGGTAVSFGTGSVGKYVVDCVPSYKIGTSAYTVQQVASVFPGYAKELKLTVTTAQPTIGTDYINFETDIEGYRFSRMGWGTASAQPITVGFWMKSSVGGTFIVQVSNSVSTYSPSFNVTAVANVPQWVTGTFAAVTNDTWLTDNGIGLRFRVYLAVGAQTMNIAATVGNTFEMTGLVILPGAQTITAAQSPLLMRPYDVELRLCERYYEVYYSPTLLNIFHAYPNGINYMHWWYHKTQKRVAPTFGFLNGAAWAVAGAAAYPGLNSTFFLVGGNYQFYATTTIANAPAAFLDARL